MPQYPIDISKQAPKEEAKVSPAERQQRSKAMDLKLEDLQRLCADAHGLSVLSLEEIGELNDKAKHLYPDVKEYYYWDRDEGIKQYYKRFAAWFKLRKELGLLNEGLASDPRSRVLDLTKFSLDSGPLTLHYLAFLPALELLASPEQAKYWVPKAKNLEITGAYVQSELGHGSDVSRLQTTATYDPATKEFVMNTPSRAATKFWPGGLGKTANHALLYARLISNGVDHGVNVFLIQIRSAEDHRPLPGLQVGDIG
jgi:alkylation response protein AidB-like acyl-CoA dehydrogenase